MDNKTFQKTVVYSSAGLVGLVALVFGNGGSLLPARPAPPVVATEAALAHHSHNPWSIDQSAGQAAAAPHDAAMTSAPPRQVYEPEDSYGAGATVDPSDSIPGEPNHSNQLPVGGMAGTVSPALVNDNSGG